MQQIVFGPVGPTAPNVSAFAAQVGWIGVPLKISPGELIPVDVHWRCPLTILSVVTLHE